MDNFKMYDLKPINDGRQSFYGKAIIMRDEENNSDTLLSYNEKVARLIKGKLELYDKWCFSGTTLRHIKEFLKQNGFKADSKAQILRDYVKSVKKEVVK